MENKNIKDYAEERWHRIDELFSVSDQGRVKRDERVINRRGYKSHVSPQLIMKNTPSGSGGYPSVLMHNKRYLIHRLVAMAFLPNPENKPQVNHIDGDKLNNHVSNLEWATSLENIRHAFSTGLNTPVQRNNKTRSKPVNSFPSVSEVQRVLGYKASNISRAVKFNKLSYGYYWKY